MRTELDNCGKFLSTEKIFHAVPGGHPMRTELDYCGKFGPKKISHFELLYPRPSKLFEVSILGLTEPVI